MSITTLKAMDISNMHGKRQDVIYSKPHRRCRRLPAFGEVLSNGGGYGNLAKKYENANKERLWASKSCFNVDLGGKTINEYLRKK